MALYGLRTANAARSDGLTTSYGGAMTSSAATLSGL